MRKILISALIFILPAFALAKDMSSRLGVGIVNDFSFDLPSVAVQYYPNAYVGYVGAFGIDTKQNNAKTALSGAVRRIIFQESNLNFFMQGGLSYQSYQTPNATGGSTGNNGFELAALMGCEFFVPGLENLGLNFLGGAAVSNIGNTRFRTVADDFLHGGIIFYF